VKQEPIEKKKEEAPMPKQAVEKKNEEVTPAPQKPALAQKKEEIP